MIGIDSHSVYHLDIHYFGRHFLLNRLRTSHYTLNELDSHLTTNVTEHPSRDGTGWALPMQVFATGLKSVTIEFSITNLCT